MIETEKSIGNEVKWDDTESTIGVKMRPQIKMHEFVEESYTPPVGSFEVSQEFTFFQKKFNVQKVLERFNGRFCLKDEFEALKDDDLLRSSRGFELITSSAKLKLANIRSL